MILTPKSFLEYIDPIKCTYKEFRENSKTYEGEYLMDVFKKNKDRSKIMKSLYNIFVKQNVNFIYMFFDNMFEVPNDIKNHLLIPSSAVNTIDYDKRIIHGTSKLHLKKFIRNLHFDEMMLSTFNNNINICDIIKHSTCDYIFSKYISRPYILDKILKIQDLSKTSRTEYSNLIDQFKRCYFIPSVLCPYTVYAILQDLFPNVLNKRENLKLFTPAMSWNSFLIAFLNTNEKMWSEYVGTDVMPNLKEKSKFMIELFDKRNITLYDIPSEDILFNKYFKKYSSNYFDVILFCPPYYNLEIYPGNKQSTSRYKDYKSWLHGYWDGTVMMCYETLKDDGLLSYIVSDSLKNVKTLVVDMMDVTLSNGFVYHNKFQIRWKNHSEYLFVFKKLSF